MKAVFISDIHYRGIEDPNTSVLTSFLNRELQGGDTLVIVGDFFDFWIGYPHVVYSEYVPILAKLYELTQKKVKLVYVEGNHDFFLGSFFKERLKAHIIQREGTMTLFGKRFYLHHGDGIDRWRFLEKLVKTKFMNVLTRIVGPNLVWKIGNYQSRASRYRGVTNPNAKLYYRKFAESLLDKHHCEVVVMGHTHLPDEHEFSPHKKYFNIGDWIHNYTYLVFENNTFQLKKYNQPL